MDKTCGVCKKTKDEGQFNWQNESKGLRQRYCRECKKKLQKKYYEKSKPQYLAKIMETRLVRRASAMELAKLYLESHPCVDCGASDIRVLEFDHVRGEKHLEVTRMIYDGYTWSRIQKEIDKCEVRCGNCHMIRTWPNRWRINEAPSSSG